MPSVRLRRVPQRLMEEARARKGWTRRSWRTGRGQGEVLDTPTPPGTHPGLERSCSRGATTRSYLQYGLRFVGGITSLRHRRLGGVFPALAGWSGWGIVIHGEIYCKDHFVGVIGSAGDAAAGYGQPGVWRVGCFAGGDPSGMRSYPAAALGKVSTCCKSARVSIRRMDVGLDSAIRAAWQGWASFDVARLS